MDLRLFAAVVAFLIAGGTLDPALVLAQEPPCDARPRWLVVTVTSISLTMAGTDSTDPVARELDFYGKQIFDRCEIEISGYENSESGEHRGSVISRNDQYGALELSRVKESVQEICAVLDDCADATVPAARE